MVVSIIIVLSIFIALVMTACVMINRENEDGENQQSGRQFKNICGEKSEENKY